MFKVKLVQGYVKSDFQIIVSEEWFLVSEEWVLVSKTCFDSFRRSLVEHPFWGPFILKEGATINM